MTSHRSFRRAGGSLLALATAIVLALAPQPSAAEAPPSALLLTSDLAATGLEAEALRAAIASELGVQVVLARADQIAGVAHLEVAGARATAVSVAFLRANGTRIERQVDVSSAGDQATDTLALLAANMMRDEAAELLASLKPPAAVVPTPTPATLAATPPAARGCEPRLPRRIPLGIDFLPYLGMSADHGLETERAVSLNVLGGMTGAVHGFELGSIFNIDAHATCGLQLSGILNLTAGPTQGLQLSMLNWTQARLDGLQLGMVNVAGADIYGAQIGMINVGAGALHGFQLSMVGVAARGLNGAQIGQVNISGGKLHGAQIGQVNVSADDVHGAQIGMVNVAAGNVKGLQLGLVNVASNSDASIGLINVLWHGRTQLDVWGTDAGLAMIGVKHGGRLIHNIYGVGASARGGRAVWASALGIGARVASPDPVFVDIDLISYGLFVHDKANSRIDSAAILQLRVPVGLQLANGLSVFVAPALNLSFADRSTDGSDNLLVAPDLFGSRKITNTNAATTVRFWPGFSAGLRFF